MRPLSDYEIEGGVVRVTNPAFFEIWMRSPEFVDALATGPSEEIRAIKRLVIEFEGALARMLLDGRVEEDVDTILERFLVEDYIQHDPNVASNGRAALAEGFRHIPLAGDVPPPPVALIVEGDLVSLLMQKPMPDPTAPGSMYDWFIPTVFRVRDGKLAEHWGALRKGDGIGPPRPVN